MPNQAALLQQCRQRESGGVQCEVMVTHQGQDHAHWISQETIDNGGHRVFGYSEEDFEYDIELEPPF